MIEGQHRHGDIALNPISAKQGVVAARDRIVLAEGEVTGHAHVIEGDVIVWQAEGQRYVEVGAKGATLTHEEHGVQTVAPGTYQVIQQREWSLEGEWQAVVD